MCLAWTNPIPLDDNILTKTFFYKTCELKSNLSLHARWFLHSRKHSTRNEDDFIMHVDRKWLANIITNTFPVGEVNRSTFAWSYITFCIIYYKLHALYLHVSLLNPIPPDGYVPFVAICWHFFSTSLAARFCMADESALIYFLLSRKGRHRRFPHFILYILYRRKT